MSVHYFRINGLTDRGCIVAHSVLRCLPGFPPRGTASFTGNMFKPILNHSYVLPVYRHLGWCYSSIIDLLPVHKRIGNGWPYIRVPSFFHIRNHAWTTGKPDEHKYTQRSPNSFLPAPGTWKFYRYRPLSTDSSIIRLLELLPGEDHIYCNIHHADLLNLPVLETIDPSQPITYEAISYTWSNKVFEQFIWCNNQVLPVTQTLYDALRRLRHETSSRVLWIDAVCINQSDTSERSQQVGHMRHIYKCATQVIPWLGEEDQYTETAFELITKIATNEMFSEASLKTDPGIIYNRSAMDQVGLPHLPAAEWKALAKLFERDYFTRVWIIQELVVSSKAIARCGNLIIKWEYIEYVARLLVVTGLFRALVKVYGSKMRPSFVNTISKCRTGFHDTRLQGGMRLPSLLCFTRRFQATDPRDKIIALLGLAKDMGHRTFVPIVPDYSKPVAELYKDVTGQLVVEDRALYLLSSVEDASDRKTQNLPSWVPDFNFWGRVSMLGMPTNRVKFRAAAKTPVSARWTAGSDILAVDAHCYDHIETVSTEALEYLPDKQRLLDWLQMAEPLMRTKGLSIDAFWRTLIANSVAEVYPAPKAYQKHFESFLELADGKNQMYLELLKTNETKGEHAANPFLYQASLAYVAPQRKFFTTSRGSIGLGPRSMKRGDLVCILSGGAVPFILRKDEEYYTLIGESYVHGIMQGEAIYGAKTRFEEFRLR